MRVVHYYARFLAHPSGVTDSVENWVRQARRAGYEAVVLCASVPAPRDVPEDLRGSVRTVTHLGRGRTSWVPTGLASEVRPGDVVYLHEGWVVSNVVAARSARARGAVVVLMPHGVYEPGITSRLRDVAGARRAAEASVVRRVDWLHVFYPSERRLADDVARGRTAPALVLPNGAPAPDEVPRWVGAGDYFLWMGRYDPDHKGIDNLLRRWAELPVPCPRLALAGPDFRGGRERTARLVRELGLDGTVELRGNARGEEKWLLITGCRAYLHPSRWESCSITLLEMLAAGVPTVVSSTIHAADPLRSAGAAVVADFARPTGLLGPLEEVDGNRDLGRRAREWTEGSATWERVGAEYRGWLSSLEEGAVR
ncbi:glycosyltransferase [Cellulosimicrobium cellulans]|uniref:glycosyltransferase family 4 protein n=1 Tax=Cellulosimicrobium cellulans TaxID=1710 RepID=UPI001965CEB0|nr:glycosyltransferase [Cellulosimicrobium cellulans]MBN0040005.1 glycosyltransferase [Cellulosimicrobium cellulans]